MTDNRWMSNWNPFYALKYFKSNSLMSSLRRDPYSNFVALLLSTSSNILSSRIVVSLFPAYALLIISVFSLVITFSSFANLNFGVQDYGVLASKDNAVFFTSPIRYAECSQCLTKLVCTSSDISLL